MTRTTLLRLLSATAIVGSLTLPALVGAHAAPASDTAPATGPAPAATPPAPPPPAPPPPAAPNPGTPPPPAAAEAPAAPAPNAARDHAGADDRMGADDQMDADDHMGSNDRKGPDGHMGWHGHMGRGGRGHGGDVAGMVFKRLDTNGDGKISQSEFAAAGQHLFEAADGNHDGIVTPREMRKGMKIARQEMSGRGMMALDTDHDGTISKDEFMAFPARIFARMDKNHDGKLEPDEILAGEQVFMKHMQRIRQHMQGGDQHRFGPPWADAEGHGGHWGHPWGHHGRWADADGGSGAGWGQRGEDGWRGDRDHRGGEEQGRGGHHMAMRGHGPAQQAMRAWLRRADTDHDGALSKAEADAANTALFKRLDADHDAYLTKDELARAAAWMQHAHGHDGDGPQHGGER